MLRLLALFLLLSGSLFAQTTLPRPWNARWISHPGIERQAYAIIHLRKSFDLEAAPASCQVHVTADNRYRLFVNGQPVGRGPARGDLRHWRYETWNLAPYLRPGKNVVAAVVWNFGDFRPQAQMSHQTGFLLQGAEENAVFLNTDASWKVALHPGHHPIDPSAFSLYSYLVVGPGERIDGNATPWGWETLNHDDSNWLAPRVLEPGYPRGTGTGADWMLVPRDIPAMTETHVRLASLRRAEGISLPAGWLPGQPLVVPPNSKVSLLLDQGQLTTAYPELRVSGGAGSRVRLTYSEATFGPGNAWALPGRKGNRNDTEGKEVIGYWDEFLPNGQAGQQYATLWWRTWRYVKLDIETAAEGLTLDDLTGWETHYPLEEKASFTASEPLLSDIWRVGWRTAELCAHETYVDCPYYEQLQYVGDTRIQALISLYVAGDDRLVKKAINDFADSRIPEGLTQSRYPCATEQVIPTFSLFWVSMLHDYWMLRNDPAFIQQHLPAAEDVIAWYLRHLNEAQLLGAHPWWNFVDWSWPWSEETRYGGVPPGNLTHSSILHFQLIYTMNQLAEMMEGFGQPEKAASYRQMATRMIAAGRQAFWSEEKKLFADTPEHSSFSQHASTFAMLAGAVPEADQPALMQRILTEPSLTQATTYFRFYLTRALVKAGMENKYLGELGQWKDMLALGLTTFAERPEPTRSDCHAWSASPNYEFLATVCGIQPAAPGFNQVRVRPAMGNLTQVEGSMPHPLGEITVKLERKGATGVAADIVLPTGLSGVFEWGEKSQALSPGLNKVKL